jgi:hypothetical protein
MSDPPPTPAGQEPIAPIAPAPAADDTRLVILEKELKEARQEAARYRTERKAQEAAALEAETKRLAEAGEFKTLAEQRAQEVAQLSADLESAKATALALERYQDAVKAIIAPRLEGLSDSLKKLVGGLEPLAQLEWVAALEPQPQAPKPQAPSLAPTNPPRSGAQASTDPARWPTLSDIYRKP